MPRELDDVTSAIRRILLNDWDPSNASQVEAARREYDCYIDPIAQLIGSGAGEQAVVDYLFDREREILCFPGLGKQRLRRVAQKLMALQST